MVELHLQSATRVAPQAGLAARLTGMLAQVVVTLLVLAALGVAAWFYLINQVDRRIRGVVEQRLSRQLAPAGLNAVIGSARRVEGRGIELRDVRIAPLGDTQTVVEIDEIFIHCDTDLERMLAQQLVIQHLEVKRPLLRVKQDATGHWNVASYWTPRPQRGAPPTVSIRDGQIAIDVAGGGSTTLRGLDLDLHPDPGAEGDEDFPHPVAVRATASNDFFRLGECEGRFDSQTGAWELEGQMQDAALSAKLLGLLRLPAEMAPLRSMAGNAQIKFRGSGLAQDDFLPSLWIDARLENGRWEDQRLPDPVTDIRAALKVSFSPVESKLEVEQCSARCGKSLLELRGELYDFLREPTGELLLGAQQFELTPRLIDYLPERLRVAWRKMSPQGLVNADLRWVVEQGRWLPDVTVDCLDVEFAYHLFPYRMAGGRGRIRCKDDVLWTTDFLADARDQVVRFQARVESPGPEFRGFVELATEGAVTIDEQLLKALDARQQLVVRSFRPRGALTAWGRFERNARGEWDRQIEVGLEDCSLEYENFRYPLERVNGTLSYLNGNWRFPDLRGAKDSAFIRCKGSWTTGERGLLEMHFEASDVPLDDKLRAALKPEAQKLWSGLGPRGTLDHLQVDLRYDAAPRKLSLAIAAQKWPPQANIEGRSLSLHPAWFQYSWENVTGGARYEDGRIELLDVRAQHGRTVARVSGAGEFSPDESWQLQLDRCVISRIHLDHELIAALPVRLGQTLRSLSAEGQLEVQGRVGLTGAAGSTPSLRCDVVVDVENGRLTAGSTGAAGATCERICGQVQLRGIVNEQGTTGQGDLLIDSMICKGVQETQVRGPLWIHADQIVFGDFMEAQKPPQRAPRSMTLKIFGGAVAANARVFLAPDTPFQLDAVADQMDFGEAARAWSPQRHDVVGRVSGGIQLQGTVAGVHTWTGRGNVRLADADLYEVPVVLALFKLLKGGNAARSTFSSCESAFRLEASQLYLDQVDLKADTLTLKGNGELGFDRRVNLIFYAMMGRDELKVPIITPALQEISKQLVQIKVEGTLDEPKVTKDAVPSISEALQQMFPELASRAQIRAETRQEGRQDGQVFPLFRQGLQRTGVLPRR